MCSVDTWLARLKFVAKFFTPPVWFGLHHFTVLGPQASRERSPRSPSRRGAGHGGMDPRRKFGVFVEGPTICHPKNISKTSPGIDIIEWLRRANLQEVLGDQRYGVVWYGVVVRVSLRRYSSLALKRCSEVLSTPALNSERWPTEIDCSISKTLWREGVATNEFTCTCRIWLGSLE